MNVQKSNASLQFVWWSLLIMSLILKYSSLLHPTLSGFYRNIFVLNNYHNIFVLQRNPNWLKHHSFEKKNFSQTRKNPDFCFNSSFVAYLNVASVRQINLRLTYWHFYFKRLLFIFYFHHPKWRVAKNKHFFGASAISRRIKSNSRCKMRPKI